MADLRTRRDQLGCKSPLDSSILQNGPKSEWSVAETILVSRMPAKSFYRWEPSTGLPENGPRSRTRPLQVQAAASASRATRESQSQKGENGGLQFGPASLTLQSNCNISRVQENHHSKKFNLTPLDFRFLLPHHRTMSTLLHDGKKTPGDMQMEEQEKMSERNVQLERSNLHNVSFPYRASVSAMNLALNNAIHLGGIRRSHSEQSCPSMVQNEYQAVFQRVRRLFIGSGERIR